MHHKYLIAAFGLGLGLANGTLHAETASPASPLVPLTKEGYRLDAPEFARLYGPGVFTMNSLTNTIVGVYQGTERMLSNRFRATISGEPEQIRIFFATGIGYSSGTGGKVRIDLYPDDGSDNHLPDLKATPLASTEYLPAIPADRRKKGYYPLIGFSGKTQALRAGQLYHLVFRNIDPDPSTNFISIDHSATRTDNGRPARWLNTLDWSTLFATRPYHSGKQVPFQWFNLTERGSSGNYFSPIMQITLKNGQSQGVSDTESGSVDPQRVYTAHADTPIRERFTPGSNKLVSGFSVATASSTAGELGWRLLDGETELGKGTIRQVPPNYQPLTTNTGILLANTHWYDVAFPHDITLKAGRSYDLEFTPVGKSEWKFAAHVNGRLAGFSWPASFTESQAQHQRKGIWINTFYWNYSRSALGSNWPVVLHLAP